MGLFERKRSVRALGPEAIEFIHQELESVLSVASSYDQLMANDEMIEISLEGRIRGDLLAFMLYLSGVSRGIDLREIQIVNKIFDIDLCHVDFTIFRNDVSDYLYEHAIPASILYLQELGTVLQREMAADGKKVDADFAAAFSVDLINLYALVGSALISADGKVTERESGDLVRYLYRMCVGAFGPEAVLPDGPAHRTLDAHIRLFGKEPKLDL